MSGLETSPLTTLMGRAAVCQICAAYLPLGPRPVFQVNATARLLIAGQAPGRKVHETGVPFDDASGDRLRDWLGIDKANFYDPKQVAILPMGFCYPGAARSGDLPPRPECAPLWRGLFLAGMPSIGLTLAIGQYAQDAYLGARRKATLTQTVRAWRDYGPRLTPLPHPSPRNNIWLAKNPWFEAEVVPDLRSRVAAILEE
jgi:uracil-DNA glycosylase